MVRKRIPERLQVWIEARQRFHLSHAQVQMARELGMNPESLGKLDNHRQEPWKLPLPQFIEQRYFNRFRKERPDVVVTLEERARLEVAKKAARRAAKQGSDLTAAAADVGVGSQQPLAWLSTPSTSDADISPASAHDDRCDEMAGH